MDKKVTNFFICMFLASMMLFISVAAGFGKSLIGEQSTCSQQFQSVEFYDDGWSMFRHDIKHTGFSNSSGPNTDTILWNYTPPGDNIWFAESSPAVAENKVYIGACEMIGLLPLFGRVYCFDGFTGEIIWDISTGGWVVSSPAVADGKVYVGSLFDGKIRCLDADDGSSIWSYTTSYWVFSSPTVYDGKIYVGSIDYNNNTGEIVCLVSTDGSLIWKYIPNSGVSSSPAVSNGKVYIGSFDGNLYCLNAETGDIIWSFNTGGKVLSSPTISDNRVYVGSINGKIYCLYAENGTEIWSYTTGDSIGSSPAIADGKVYIGSYDTKFYCLDALTGNQIWNYSVGRIVFSSPAIADGKIYVGCGSSFGGGGKINCLDAMTGECIWNYSTYSQVASSPAVVNGKLYVSSQEGSLYCFCDDLPPAKPSRPSGSISGEVGVPYDYSTSTTDPDGNMIKYGWDWNGDKVVDEWTSFHPSGATVTTSHTWQQMGIHVVRVRAEDTVGIQSEWSNPLVVIMPQMQIQKSCNFQVIVTKERVVR
jgi:outer membrane protein assembly factor BamB